MGFQVLAIPDAAAGSEQAPEIVGTGEVVYDVAYPGPKDHDYLGIVAGWVEFDSQADAIAFNLKGVDYSIFARAPPSDSTIICIMNATVFLETEFQGYLVFRLLNDYHADHFRTENDLNLFNPNRSPIPIRQAPLGTFAKPGYLQWHVDRNLMLNYADEFSQFFAHCNEQYFPDQYPRNPVMPSGPIQNYGDSNMSSARFSISNLTPARGNDTGDILPGRGTVGTGDTEPAAGSPSPPWLAILMVVAGASLAKRRRFRHDF